MQVVYRIHGINLKRDAYQQAEQGKPVSPEDAQPGDMAFFANDNGKVTHVGIVLPSNQIIHASGEVRIDVLDKKGIYNEALEKHTHTFHSVRRMI